MNYQALGARIRLQRKSRGMTQAELAEMADVSVSFLGHIERGSRKASLDTFAAICNALQVTPMTLLQDSLSGAALGGDLASRKDIMTEISNQLIEQVREWSKKS